MKSPSKLRRQIAFEAAQLIYRRQEEEYYRAKMKAARQICRHWVKPADLPSNSEIRNEVLILARTLEGEDRSEQLLEMRLEALRMMRLLANFRPRLVGSVLTGHVRQGSDIDLHLFSHGLAAVSAILDEEGIVYDVQRKIVRKHQQETTYHHIHISDRFPMELTIYPANQAHVVSKCSVTGKAIERATAAELQRRLEQEYPHIDLAGRMDQLQNQVDRFQVYLSLLLPLESVKQDPRYHPEGDALYHSMQVFMLAHHALPYDEEFQSAALLHDVGKAICPYDHVAAGLEALQGFVTQRTSWLIRFHMDAHRVRSGSIGARARRRLRANENFDDLMLLSQCDIEGRKPGAEVWEVEQALDHLRDLDQRYR